MEYPNEDGRYLSEDEFDREHGTSIEEDDVTTEDFCRFYANGKLVLRDMDDGTFDFPTLNERAAFRTWQEAFRSLCDEDCYYPSLFRVSDHGNIEEVAY